MTSFLTKIIVYPIIILISNYLSAEINYPYLYQILFVGVMLAASVHLIEWPLLKPGFLLTTTILEFLVAFSVIYFIQFLLPGSYVSLIGTSIASTTLIVVQFLCNRYILYDNLTKKSN
ncbi:hypothetical protein [Clostridium thailandense]|uniref:DUF2512 family protein n=1 Tax=Clostridium thailandense TaxID=2794346 RepID=A0A949WWW7_9CLOT|nr:hypothetical protein [Clostridium thailandense]MBV7275287.1 hypothetical protein [Clostridium thailandense]MCH5135803.1 hypothetical protein [Clostridiaceae bacterium UIB06]